MPPDLVDQAMELMQMRRFADALPLLRQAIADDPTIWGRWYMAGQCCRFTNDIDGAIHYLSHAAEMNPQAPQVYHALGIAFQLRGQFDQAFESFGEAIEADPDYELAYNSLALTQKLAGELNKAVQNYDAGLKALARRIVKSMENDASNPILKYQDMVGQRWVEQAAYAALWLVSENGIDRMAWPTGEQAIEEERSQLHGGFYWLDSTDDRDQRVRLFLPNYFNTFREELKRSQTYADMIGNWGTVLQLLGKPEEARQHFQEAREFLAEQ